MSIVVTGATGSLGGHVVRHLLDRGVDPSEVVAGGRREGRLAELADEHGVRTARIDYEDPASVDAVFAAGDRVLLISGSEVGRRVEQHRNVIEAADRAGVALLAYTSILQADDNPVSLAEEHRATEAQLAGASVPTVLLRNGWYLENYTGQLPTYLHTGSVIGATGGGRIAAATRDDFAAAAAAVLADGDPTRSTYELGGESFTLEELAAAISSASGQDVGHQDLPLAAFRKALTDAGLPGPVVAMLVSADAAIAAGALDTASTDLADLLGRRPTTMPDAVAAALG